MPAHLKALLDHTMPFSSMAMQKVGDRYEHVCQTDFSRLRYLMICGCGFPNSKHNFEPAVAQFMVYALRTTWPLFVSWRNAGSKRSMALV